MVTPLTNYVFTKGIIFSVVRSDMINDLQCNLAFIMYHKSLIVQTSDEIMYSVQTPRNMEVHKLFDSMFVWLKTKFFNLKILDNQNSEQCDHIFSEASPLLYPGFQSVRLYARKPHMRSYTQFRLQEKWRAHKFYDSLFVCTKLSFS